MATAPKKLRATPARVAKVLKQARDLMNDQGAHWIQGKLRKTDPKTGEVSFCSVGAIQHIAKGPENAELRLEALMTLAETVSVSFDRTRIFGAPGDAARGAVIIWNDNPARSWDAIDAKFAEAQKRARASK